MTLFTRSFLQPLRSTLVSLSLLYYPHAYYAIASLRAHALMLDGWMDDGIIIIITSSSRSALNRLIMLMCVCVCIARSGVRQDSSIEYTQIRTHIRKYTPTKKEMRERTKNPQSVVYNNNNNNIAIGDDASSRRVTRETKLKWSLASV